MEEEAVKRLVKQITTLWVEPEIKRINFKEKIFAILILFKETSSPQILFNGETSFKVTIDPSVGGKLIPGQPVTLNDLAKHKIKNITIPDRYFDEHAFLAAVTINGKWFIKFNFSYNKTEALKKISKAEGFLQAAKAVEVNDIKSYNLFHSLEQIIHAYFLFRPGMKDKIQKGKKHKSIQKYVNLDFKIGNFPKDLKDLFNSLLNSRSSIYNENVSFTIKDSDIKNVENFITNLKKRTEQE
jgi:hypothetical protein